MCPKDEIISAYLDGEVESPWAEKLKIHISTCKKCAQRLADMQNLRSRLLDEAEPDFGPALQRLRRRVYFHSVGQGSTVPARTPRELPFWKRKVNLPMPAAVALSFMLFLLFASFFFFMGQQNNIAMAKREPASYKSQPVQVTVPINGMQVDNLEVLLKLLNNKDFSQEVLMQLPKDSQFSVFGEPEIEKISTDRQGE